MINELSKEIYKRNQDNGRDLKSSWSLMERRQRKQKECKQLNINTMFEEAKNNSILKEGPMCEKLMSPGEEIAERLKGYSPSDKKRALREAEDIINKGYAFEMEKIKGMESALNKEWEEFQQS